MDGPHFTSDDSSRNAVGEASPAGGTAEPGTGGHVPAFRRNEVWKYFGPAFVASIAYIDPGNFATNIEGGSRFGYRLLWVLLWSNAMAILIQYLSAKLGIVTGLTLPQNCRKHFSRPMTISLWVAAEIAAIATDLAEFIGAALGLYLLFGPALLAHGWSATQSLLAAALVSTVLVFGILALDLAGFRWFERGIMVFLAIVGACYAVEVFLVHPNWQQVALHTLLPTFATGSKKELSSSVYLAVSMLGATVMPHVIYLHSALVQPRRVEMSPPPKSIMPAMVREYLRYELIDVFAAMNGAWLINSAMIIMAAVAFSHGAVVDDVEVAYKTLGPLLGPMAAGAFAVALLCSGLSSSTVGVMAGQVIIEGFLHIRFPIFLRRLITVIPAIVVIAVGLSPLKIIVLSQAVLSFTLPAALIPLLILTNRAEVMSEFASARRTRIAGWASVAVIVTLNVVLLVQLAMA
jgi:manganese transport protein